MPTETRGSRWSPPLPFKSNTAGRSSGYLSIISVRRCTVWSNWWRKIPGSKLWGDCSDLTAVLGLARKRGLSILLHAIFLLLLKHRLTCSESASRSSRRFINVLGSATTLWKPKIPFNLETGSWPLRTRDAWPSILLASMLFSASRRPLKYILSPMRECQTHTREIPSMTFKVARYQMKATTSQWQQVA